MTTLVEDDEDPIYLDVVDMPASQQGMIGLCFSPFSRLIPSTELSDTVD